LKLEARVEPEHLLVDENLPVDAHAGSDANRRYLQKLRYRPRGRRWDALEHEREKASGLLERTRIRGQDFDHRIGPMKGWIALSLIASSACVWE
jgi:hypothetical protein